MKRQLVCSFADAAEKKHKAAVVGGKGAGLADMVRLNLNVPPGFIIVTDACLGFLEAGKLPPRFKLQYESSLRKLERQTGKYLGSVERPLIVSVRSGAPVSMPGMLDTVLNLGITPESADHYYRTAGTCFLWECYCSFLLQYCHTVLGIPSKQLDALRKRISRATAKYVPRFLSRILLSRTATAIRQFAEEQALPIPVEPAEQLREAVYGVFRSWNNERAVIYRQHHRISENLGTAVVIQTMVFGNLDEESCTGVVFSRNISSGANQLYGEFMTKAQGEVLVGGNATPRPIAELAELSPAVYAELEQIISSLDRHYKDIVDVEFTVESGQLYILQVRRAKRSMMAAAVNAVQRVRSQEWRKAKAVALAKTMNVQNLVNGSFEMDSKTRLHLCRTKPYLTGLAAAPGAISGRAAFTIEQAKKYAAGGEGVIYVRSETLPDDLPGMIVSNGILTAKGGKSSHAALTATELGIPAVVGVSGLLRVTDHAARGYGMTINAGDIITIDGSHGMVYKGKVSGASNIMSEELMIYLKWINKTDLLPRINLNSVTECYSLNKMLNDFYISQSMFKYAKNSFLADETMALKEQVVAEISGVFACYLTMASAGELRHFPSSVRNSIEYRSHVKWLTEELEFWDYGSTDAKIFNYMKTRPVEDVVRFLEIATDMFRASGWSSGYGGKKWAMISEAPLLYLTNRVNRTIFVDHAFDLQHNGGCAFNKHSMFYNKSVLTLVQAQLDFKANTPKLTELYSGLLKLSNEISVEVRDMYAKGLTAGLWVDQSEQNQEVAYGMAA